MLSGQISFVYFSAGFILVQTMRGIFLIARQTVSFETFKLHCFLISLQVKVGFEAALVILHLSPAESFGLGPVRFL